MRRLRLGFTITLILGATACGAAAPPATSPTVTTGVVGGHVRAASSGFDVSGLTVTAGGPGIVSRVGSRGDFVLANVPAGPLTLHFAGAGLAAGLDLGELSGGETITLVIVIAGSQLRVDTIARIHGDDAVIEGTVEPPPPGLPDGSIVVGGRTVTLPADKPDVRPGMRVRVSGTLTAAGIQAREVIIR